MVQAFAVAPVGPEYAAALALEEPWQVRDKIIKADCCCVMEFVPL
jgi:hypothetical protein